VAIRIEALSHGEDRMWLAMGPFMCDRAVIKDLAGPIYSASGVTWFVAFDGDRPVGFASLREHNGAHWFDYDYVAADMRKKGVFGKLAKARDKHIKGLAKPARSLIQEKRWPHYEERGWTIVSQRKSWLTIERTTP
jgi:hypothetical protein